MTDHPTYSPQPPEAEAAVAGPPPPPPALLPDHPRGDGVVQVVLIDDPGGGLYGDGDAETTAPAEKQHHLTRHWLAPEARGGGAIVALGADGPKAAEQLIRSMGQRELRQSFQKVYGTPTNSFNNNWLRRKLYEAVGVTGGGAKRAKRSRPAQAAAQRSIRQAATAEAEAEALEALAEMREGDPKAASASASASSRSGGGGSLSERAVTQPLPREAHTD